MTTHCSACTHMDEPGTGPHCGPCQWPLDPSARPSGFVPIQAQAPAHPPSAPFTDTQRLEWLLPAMATVDDPARVGDRRTAALAAALMLGKSGRDAIDFAMEGSK